MKVKLTQGRVGVTENGVAWSQEPGEEIDVPDPEAKRMIERGMAREVKDVAAAMAGPKRG